MTNEELKQAITAMVPTAAFEEGEMFTVNIASNELLPLMEYLKSAPELYFDYLFCLTCVDWKTHLTMVYHMLSKRHRHQLVVKAKIADTVNPGIASLCRLWKTANFLEREVYDLFGVRFAGHPDLRRILMEEGWDGYPLRKNYVDENMISI